MTSKRTVLFWAGLGVLALGLAGLAVVGFAPIRSADELVGKYVFSDDPDDCIQVLKDGTYIHAYPKCPGKDHQEVGKWSFEKRNGESRITFDDFLLPPRPHSEMGRGFWDVEPTRKFGTIYLMLDLDTGLAYRRKR
jgi:hypothetical protein